MHRGPMYPMLYEERWEEWKEGRCREERLKGRGVHREGRGGVERGEGEGYTGRGGVEGGVEGGGGMGGRRGREERRINGREGRGVESEG